MPLREPDRSVDAVCVKCRKIYQTGAGDSARVCDKCLNKVQVINHPFDPGQYPKVTAEQLLAGADKLRAGLGWKPEQLVRLKMARDWGVAEQYDPARNIYLIFDKDLCGVAEAVNPSNTRIQSQLHQVKTAPKQPCQHAQKKTIQPGCGTRYNKVGRTYCLDCMDEVKP